MEIIGEARIDIFGNCEYVNCYGEVHCKSLNITEVKKNIDEMFYIKKDFTQTSWGFTQTSRNFPCTILLIWWVCYGFNPTLTRLFWWPNYLEIILGSIKKLYSIFMKLFGGGSYARIKTRSLYSYRKTLCQSQRLIHWINMLNTFKVNHKDSRTTSIEVACSAVFIVPFEFIQVISPILPQHKKWSFALRIFSVNVTKSEVFCGFGHIYWRNP